jgi:protein TonB
MFETIAQSSRVSARRRVLAVLTSMAAHTAAILVLVVAPLLLVDAFPASVLLTFLVAPPPPAPVPPIPSGDGVLKAGGKPSRIQRVDFTTPTTVPKTIPAPEDDLGSIGPVSVGVGAGVSAVGPGTIGPSLIAADARPVPLPPPPRPVKRPPERVSTGVQESKLVHRVDPVYPELARRARVSGVVILEVTVDEEGNVADIRVLRGHPLLDEEAVRAVRQWKYSPTLLNGEPVPVIATVTVIFSLR